MAGPAGKRYSLLLINPRRRYRYYWDFKELCKMMRKRASILPLALPVVAALTPEQYDITIIDEEMEPLRFEPKPDLVGITAIGPNVKRGYEIADRFRALGVPVVMGGPQVSFNVEETLRHADTVVIGEAEGIWTQCLADFEAGRMKPTYKRDTIYDYAHPVRPRWDLINTGKLMTISVQASRGCPFKCDFCIVRNMFGQEHRYRDMDELIAEIKSLPKKQLGFVDDNLTANKPYARELMRRLKPLNVSWGCQASLDVTQDDDLLRDMAEAGCTSILLGIESVNPEALREQHKYQNRVEKYEEGIRRVHSHGIHVIGSFIVGYDADRLDAFEQIYEFTLRTNIAMVILNCLTAYPGTDLYDRLKAQGRISPIDPDLLNGVYPTMQYRHMSQTEMFNKSFETMARLFAPEVILQKAEKVFANGRFQRFSGGDLTVVDKAMCFWHLFRHLRLSSDPHKRKLFTELIRLGFRKKAAMGNVIQFLLLVLSFSGYHEFLLQNREEVLAKIRQDDPGPLERS